MKIRARLHGRSQRFATLLLILLSIGLLFGMFEAGFRITRYVVRGPNSLPTVEHHELGWVHNTKRTAVSRSNSCGELVLSQPAPTSYIVKYPKDHGGMRVLFLGDSTTHAHEVSTEAAFYDVVEALGRGRYSVWAAGVGGYGSLQEYLLLRKIYEAIRPDIVIWQLDSNDIADNVYELDRASISSSMKRRPYFDPHTGQIVYRNPAVFPFNISHGARFLLSQLVALDLLYNFGMVKSVENWLGPIPERQHALRRQGLEVLDHVVGEVRRQYPQTRLIGLATVLDPADDRAYEEVFRGRDAEYWPNFTARVRLTSGEPTDCVPWDRHWNHEGNRVAGQLIGKSLDVITK